MAIGIIWSGSIDYFIEEEDERPNQDHDTPHYIRACLESMHVSSTLHQVDTDYCSKKR
jgi:hypothetical protein